jgi:NTE family protein
MASVPGPIAFVFPGGAAWGAVQVGVLGALTDAGIVPDLLVGTSVGALNAAMFSAAPTAAGVESLAQLWCAARRRQIFPLSPVGTLRAIVRHQGHLIGNAGLRRWIAAHIAFERIEDAPIPLHVMATDLAAGVPVMLSSGDAVTALTASCAIPGVFPPVRVGDRLFVDGGATADHPIPQALALGAATVFELSTYGRDDAASPLRRRLLQAADRRFGRPPDAADANGTRPPVGVPGVGHAEAGASAGRPDPVVHVLPAPSTVDVNPFSFRRSRHLIDQAAELTAAWLAEHLDRPGAAPAPATAPRPSPAARRAPWSPDVPPHARAI